VNSRSHVARLSDDERPLLDDFTDEFASKVGEAFGIDLSADFDVSVFRDRYVSAHAFADEESKAQFYLDIEGHLSEFRAYAKEYAVQRLMALPNSVFKFDTRRSKNLEDEMFEFVDRFFDNVATKIQKPTQESFRAMLEDALKSSCIEIFQNPNILASNTGKAVG
jgi:hypothetical protein